MNESLTTCAQEEKRLLMKEVENLDLTTSIKSKNN